MYLQAEKMSLKYFETMKCLNNDIISARLMFVLRQMFEFLCLLFIGYEQITNIT